MNTDIDIDMFKQSGPEKVAQTGDSCVFSWDSRTLIGRPIFLQAFGTKVWRFQVGYGIYMSRWPFQGSKSWTNCRDKGSCTASRQHPRIPLSFEAFFFGARSWSELQASNMPFIQSFFVWFFLQHQFPSLIWPCLRLVSGHSAGCAGLCFHLRHKNQSVVPKMLALPDNIWRSLLKATF